MIKIPFLNCRKCKTTVAKDIEISGPDGIHFAMMIRCGNCKNPVPVVFDIQSAVRVSIAGDDVKTLVNGEEMLPKDREGHVRTL